MNLFNAVIGSFPSDATAADAAMRLAGNQRLADAVKAVGWRAVAEQAIEVFHYDGSVLATPASNATPQVLADHLWKMVKRIP